MKSRKKYIRLKKLIYAWTRAEIMARFGVSKGLSFGDYAMKSADLRDEIRELLYGTSDLITLGEKWKLPLPKSEKETRRKHKEKE